MARIQVKLILIDEDQKLDVSKSKVIESKPFMVEDTDKEIDIIMAYMIENPVNEALEAHNTIRKEMTYENANGDDKPLKPVKLKDLTWKVLQA